MRATAIRAKRRDARNVPSTMDCAALYSLSVNSPDSFRNRSAATSEVVEPLVYTIGGVTSRRTAFCQDRLVWPQSSANLAIEKSYGSFLDSRRARPICKKIAHDTSRPINTGFFASGEDMTIAKSAMFRANAQKSHLMRAGNFAEGMRRSCRFFTRNQSGESSPACFRSTSSLSCWESLIGGFCNGSIDCNSNFNTGAEFQDVLKNAGKTMTTIWGRA